MGSVSHVECIHKNPDLKPTVNLRVFCSYHTHDARLVLRRTDDDDKLRLGVKRQTLAETRPAFWQAGIQIDHFQFICVSVRHKLVLIEHPESLRSAWHVGVTVSWKFTLRQRAVIAAAAACCFLRFLKSFSCQTAWGWVAPFDICLRKWEMGKSNGNTAELMTCFHLFSQTWSSSVIWAAWHWKRWYGLWVHVALSDVCTPTV